MNESERLSIIIPARNEADHLAATLARAGSGDGVELIVVDARSTDATAAIARAHGARVLCARPSRGRQMNLGAAAAAGELLLFLHADTLLPAGFDAIVREILSRPGVVAGAFRMGIDAPQRRFRLIERCVNWRSRALRMPYGDQALFLRAETFRRVGGYPDFPLMEDYELVRRLRPAGRIEIADAAVTTSPRRWLRLGVCRATLRNQLCVLAYQVGIAPERIARWR